MNVEVFHAPQVGLRAYLRRFWGEKCPGKYGYHDARVVVDEVVRDVPGMLVSEVLEELFGTPADYAEHQWPTACDACGALAPLVDEDNRARQVFVDFTHDVRGVAIGRRELPAGAAFWAKWKHERDAAEPNGCFDRDVCDPRGHLVVVCPDGVEWDVMSRAGNCTAKADRIHFCWVLHGDLSDPRTLTVDKGGNTCNAGAGSIQTGGYHGFLQHGFLVKC